MSAGLVEDRARLDRPLAPCRAGTPPAQQ